MPDLHLVFPLAGGLHARPATALRAFALTQDATLTWINERTGRRASLRSVLGLLGTETRAGDACRIEVTGSRPDVTARALEAFLGQGFLTTDALPEPAQPAGALPVPRLLARLGEPWWSALPLSPGLAMGPACHLAPAPTHVPEGRAQDPRREEDQLLAALLELEARVQAEATRASHPTTRGILEAHAAMLADEDWRAAMVRHLREDGCTAAVAVHRAAEGTCAELAASPMPGLQTRALDVQGLAHRLIHALQGGPGEAPVIQGEGILFAERLTPSHFLALDRSRLQALVLGEGGAASHTAILARSFGLPCVGLAPGLFTGIRAGQPVLVDGRRGLVVPEPSTMVQAYFQVEQAAQLHRSDWLRNLALRPALTRDGTPVKVLVNLTSPEEAAGALAKGADGVGLFRTEMLFMEGSLPPSEARQVEAYLHMVRAAQGRPVVLRLLDAGGDKPLPFLPLPREANPFLGRRGVRWYRQQEALVRTQVRAALRATQAGPLRLLVPMVTDPEELRWVRSVVASEAERLRAEGQPLPGDVALGMMVEVPAAALALEGFADLADFFSLGTNDLLQYLFAEDRGDPELGRASRAWHPATLRLLDQVARRAEALGREVSLCGELAGDPRLLPLLVGLGFRTFSVAPGRVPELKAAIGRLEVSACRSLAVAALDAATEAEVGRLFQTIPAPTEPLPLLDPALVLLDTVAASKEEALRLLAERVAAAGRCADADDLEAALWEREAAYSTGIGHGIAVPHAKVDGAGGLVVCRLREGLDWGALDGQPVRLILLLASAGDAETHLRSFARLARRLMDPAFRQALLTATGPDAILAHLRTDTL